MKEYPIAIYFNDPEVHFDYQFVARMARVSEEFIIQCEGEELIIAHTMLHGKKGLKPEDISKLKLIRYLHQDMGLALDAVDFVLRYRERVKKMERQLHVMELKLRQKEQDHQAEILDLCRRLSQLMDEK